jgi:L-iditol 2-dehydrogenase
VHEVGSSVARFKVGQRVALAHHVPDPNTHYSKRDSETMDPQFKSSNIDPGGFAEFIRVPSIHVESTVVAIPDHVSDANAVFMEPMACCLRALDRMILQKGDSVLVIGTGAIGMLFMPLLRDLGVHPIAADVRPERIETAKQFGAVAGGIVGQDDLPSICKSASEGRGVDAVILTVVNDAAIALALSCVRDGGSLMLFGGKPGTKLALPYWDAFLREINFVTSYSATPSGLHRAMKILAQPQYKNLEQLISHRIPLAEAQSGFELTYKAKASKAVIIPGSL